MTAEKEYKAVVKNKRTKKIEIISLTACNLTHALREIRANGYSVNNYHCKSAEVFDYIMDHTNATPWDWKEIKALPQDFIDK